MRKELYGAEPLIHGVSIIYRGMSVIIEMYDNIFFCYVGINQTLIIGQK